MDVSTYRRRYQFDDDIWINHRLVGVPADSGKHCALDVVQRSGPGRLHALFSTEIGTGISTDSPGFTFTAFFRFGSVFTRTPS